MPKLEISQLQLPAKYLVELQKLLLLYVPCAQVWAYGSRVNGVSHDGSDLDLVLRNFTNLTASCDGYLQLKEALQDSRIPILVDIHDWAHLPPEFQRNIEQNYIELQAA